MQNQTYQYPDGASVGVFNTGSQIRLVYSEPGRGETSVTIQGDDIAVLQGSLQRGTTISETITDGTLASVISMQTVRWLRDYQIDAAEAPQVIDTMRDVIDLVRPNARAR